MWLRRMCLRGRLGRATVGSEQVSQGALSSSAASSTHHCVWLSVCLSEDNNTQSSDTIHPPNLPHAPTSKPNQKPSPITPPPNNTHHNAIHHSLTSPSPVNPNSSPMTPKPQTYRSHIYPLSHNSLCYSLNPQNHDTQTTTPLPISQISIPHIHTKDQQPLHTSIPTHTNNIPASRITLPLHRSSMPHY